MKQLAVTLILMVISLGAWAQYAGTGTIRRAGSHIEMNGERLSPDAQAALLADIGGKDYNAAWEQARKGRNTGTGLAIGGGAAFLVGGTVGMLGLTTSLLGAAVGGTIGSIGGKEGAQQGAEEGAQAGGPIMTAGLVVAGLGLVATGIGIPMIVSNTRMMNGIVNTYNNGGRPSAQVSFGATDNGIGLALRF